LFVKELEVAMSEGRADLAVHSLKMFQWSYRMDLIWLPFWSVKIREMRLCLPCMQIYRNCPLAVLLAPAVFVVRR
jgi:hypothetical protein